MEPGISSVSLSQVTPIIVVLASGIAVAIFITIAERLMFWMPLRYNSKASRDKPYLKKHKIFHF
jgi:hypothetical protein